MVPSDPIVCNFPTCVEMSVRLGTSYAGVIRLINPQNREVVHTTIVYEPKRYHVNIPGTDRFLEFHHYIRRLVTFIHRN